MSRLLTFLMVLGVLTGMLSGRFVHVHHESAEACGQVHSIAHHHASDDCGEHQHSADLSSPKECKDHQSGQCHQHACQHSISPGVSIAHVAFAPISQLLGSVPAAPAFVLDEPVYELDTPPLI